MYIYGFCTIWKGGLLNRRLRNRRCRQLRYLYQFTLVCFFAIHHPLLNDGYSCTITCCFAVKVCRHRVLPRKRRKQNTPVGSFLSLFLLRKESPSTRTAVSGNTSWRCFFHRRGIVPRLQLFSLSRKSAQKFIRSGEFLLCCCAV